jgi:hypothetical protein
LTCQHPYDKSFAKKLNFWQLPDRGKPLSYKLDIFGSGVSGGIVKAYETAFLKFTLSFLS